jgi:hypothetical protein
MDNENKKDALIQQDFPSVEGDKTLVERQKNQVMESHDLQKPTKMIGGEETPSALVG